MTREQQDSSLPAVFVVGAGIMGAGIAQIAAQAGHVVYMFDTRAGAAGTAIEGISAQLQRLVAKGKLDAQHALQVQSRLRAAQDLTDAMQAGLVVEAIVENLEAKRALFQQLEAVVPANCVLASNTSSISITAIARGLQDPSRLVGMHFFNPVPLMQLVEVVSGLKTRPDVAERVAQLASAWGKTPVHARSTPGFIVNRIARPFYAEALALLGERAARPEVIDECLRGAGFRMGPCELMDLIGHDTNFAVTNSVFAANYFDRRYGPSQVQQELVEAGLLGRKSGEGFYRYPADAVAPALLSPDTDLVAALSDVVLHGDGVLAQALAQVLARVGVVYMRQVQSEWEGLDSAQGQLRLTDGRPAAQVAAHARVAQVAVVDLALSEPSGASLAWTAAASGRTDWRETVASLLALAGWRPVVVADSAGLVVARTVAMLINEAADAVLQGVCDEDGADTAMRLGANYPAGPHDWLRQWGAPSVVRLLDHLDAHYRGERYRVSPGLRQRVWQLEAAA